MLVYVLEWFLMLLTGQFFIVIQPVVLDFMDLLFDEDLVFFFNTRLTFINLKILLNIFIIYIRLKTETNV